MFVLILLFAAIACVSTGQAETRFLSKPLGSSRIINGGEAIPYEFPHQATLLRNGGLLCGASIIAKDWALTAAHCVDGQTMSSLTVVVDLHYWSDLAAAPTFNILQIIKHGSYNTGPGAFPNDVALLRLDTAGVKDLTSNIIPLDNGVLNHVHKTCIISGWGVTRDGTTPPVLQKADVQVLNKTHCESYWGSRNILSQHVCVKGYDTEEGTGSCNGDSGGPLICPNGSDGYELVGVTSWGRSGCHDNGDVTHPSVYASVSFFHEWISNNCENCV